MPEIPDVIPGEPIESGWGNDIRDRVIQRFADATARANSVPFPQEGQPSYLDDPGVLEIFDGNDWITYIYEETLQDGLALQVSRSGSTMSGPLTLFGDPTQPLHAATAQFVTEQDLIPQDGQVVDVDGFQGTVLPGMTDTVLASVEIDIPANAQGRPVFCIVNTMLRSAAAEAGDAFEVWSSIDGNFNLRSTTGFLDGGTGVSSLTASNNNIVNLALPGTGFTVDFLGRIRSGTPGSWHLNAFATVYMSP